MKGEAHALYLAMKDPRTPWYARAVAVIVVGYALSPIDLIPDPIPILGYLDDLILIPLGIMLVIKLIPPEVIRECRERAAADLSGKGPTSRVAGGVIICVWIALFLLVCGYALKWVKK